MLELLTLTDVFATGGTVGIAGILFFYLIKLLSSRVSDGVVNITQNRAKVDIIEQLREEINRIRDDLNELKENHKIEMLVIKNMHDEERIEWKLQLANLEKQFEFLKNKNENMRSEALDAYTYITTREDLFKATYAEELKERLMRIIVDENK